MDNEMISTRRGTRKKRDVAWNGYRQGEELRSARRGGGKEDGVTS